jgi:hypothetical protein
MEDWVTIQTLKKRNNSLSNREIGSSFPMEKDQSVLAVKLNQKDIEERFIKFQEEEYILKKENFENGIIRKLSHLEKNNSLKFSSIVELSEYQDVLIFIKQYFNWKPGKYLVQFLLNSPSKISVKDDFYSFELNNLDIEKLEKNKEFVNTTYENIAKLYSKSDDEEEIVDWKWCYPVIKKGIQNKFNSP